VRFFSCAAQPENIKKGADFNFIQSKIEGSYRSKNESFAVVGNRVLLLDGHSVYAFRIIINEFYNGGFGHPYRFDSSFVYFMPLKQN
jgi:hypothetical protein